MHISFLQLTYQRKRYRSVVPLFIVIWLSETKLGHFLAKLKGRNYTEWWAGAHWDHAHAVATLGVVRGSGKGRNGPGTQEGVESLVRLGNTASPSFGTRLEKNPSSVRLLNGLAQQHKHTSVAVKGSSLRSFRTCRTHLVLICCQLTR